MTEEEQTQEQNTEQTQETNTNGLIVIANGAVAESKPLNDNFSYLNARADSLKQDITEVNNALNSSVGTKTQAYLDKNFRSIIYMTDEIVDGNIQIKPNCIYVIKPTNVTTLTITNANSTFDAEKFNQILVQLVLTDIRYINASSLGALVFFDNNTPTFSNTGVYDIIYEYDNYNSSWCCGVLYKGTITQQGES